MVLANPEIAHHLTVDSLLYDPNGWLRGLLFMVHRSTRKCTSCPRLTLKSHPAEALVVESKYKSAGIAPGRLGFSRRLTSFIPSIVAIGDLPASEVWLIWAGDEPVGYAFARVSEPILEINHLLLVPGLDPVEAVAALAQAQPAPYIVLRASQSSVLESLRRLGCPPPQPDWGTFMVKSLDSDVTADDFSRLCGVGTEQFMISPIDIT